MQETRTSEKSVEEDTDFSSFREAQSEYKTEVQHGRSGTARLESCELVEYSEIPSHTRKHGYSHSKNYFRFEAELSNTEKKIKVICPAEDDDININTVLKWARASEIEELAGKRVPITHLKDDYYGVETFSRKQKDLDLSFLPVNIIKSMIDNGFIEFKNGEWRIPNMVAVVFSGLIMSIMFIPLMVAAILPTMVLSLAALSLYPVIIGMLHKMSR